MANERILIVDDDPAIRQALRIAFMREKMQTMEASSGTQALQLLSRERADLVILDVMMQDMDGFEVLQRIRSSGNVVPVLMLSGRSDATDQVLGLGIGADDYLTKPFHASVLTQKVKALLRRSRVYDQTPEHILTAGPFRLDTRKLECYKNETPLMLTAKELILFRFFLENPEQVFTREQLYRNVWNETAVDDNTIMVYIKRLREKIEDDAKKPTYIRTVRGIGYVFHQKN